MWDLRTNDRLARVDDPAISGTLWRSAPAGGLDVLVTAEDHPLEVWDLDAGSLVTTLRGHVRHVRGLAMSADGRRLVSASWDGTLRVWDLRATRLLKTISDSGLSGRTPRSAMTAGWPSPPASTAAHTCGTSRAGSARQPGAGWPRYGPGERGRPVTGRLSCRHRCAGRHDPRVGCASQPVRTLTHRSFQLGERVAALSRRGGHGHFRQRRPHCPRMGARPACRGQQASRACRLLSGASPRPPAAGC